MGASMAANTRLGHRRERDDAQLVDLELADIFRAIASGEVIPHYQALVSFHSGRLIGVEALARWERPGLGELNPDVFVPLLEQARRVSDLTAWMLDQVSMDLCRWRSDLQLPGEFSVAVNVSATELADRRLVRLTQEALRRHALPDGALCLEVTETAFIDDLRTAAALMRELRALGIRLALDDCGSGAATVDTLSQLPFDMVKIDQCYVSSMASADSLAFITELVDLADELGLEVVAEGIETREQVDALRSLGCGHGQGFGLGRPTPGDNVFATWWPPLAAL